METLNNTMPIINEQPMETRKFHPVKFVVWLMMIGSGMLFMAFTSALIVSKSDGVVNGAWLEYDIPMWFTVSTILVILTSVLMHLAFIQLKKGNKSKAVTLTGLTMLGGIGFIISQIMGYSVLVDAGVYFSNEQAADIAGSYFYVITGAHLVHILLGLAILLYTFIQLIRDKISSSKSIMMYVGTFYWHFLGFLWIYLFLLLNLTR